MEIRKKKSTAYWLKWILAAWICEELLGLGAVVIFIACVCNAGVLVGRFKNKNGDEYEVYR